MRRLARARGHLESIIRMIDAKKSCPEVLQQMTAVIAALESTRKVFLEDHMRGCIVEAVHSHKAGRAIEEFERALVFMR